MADWQLFAIFCVILFARGAKEEDVKKYFWVNFGLMWGALIWEYW